MAVLNWIVSNILTQASIIIALIAFLGLVLQRSLPTRYLRAR